MGRGGRGGGHRRGRGQEEELEEVKCGEGEFGKEVWRRRGRGVDRMWGR